MNERRRLIINVGSGWLANFLKADFLEGLNLFSECDSG